MALLLLSRLYCLEPERGSDKHGKGWLIPLNFRSIVLPSQVAAQHYRLTQLIQNGKLLQATQLFLLEIVGRPKCSRPRASIWVPTQEPKSQLQASSILRPQLAHRSAFRGYPRRMLRFAMYRAVWKLLDITMSRFTLGIPLACLAHSYL